MNIYTEEKTVLMSRRHSVAGILPEELVVEILVKVPARWVVVLRCVCKSWNSVITDPQFASTHFDHNRSTKQILLIDFCNHLLRKSLTLFSPHDNEQPQPQPPHTFIDIHSRAPRRLDFLENPNFADFFKDCVFSGSINGIICISLAWNMRYRWVALWNPAINHWKLISIPPAKGGDSVYTSSSLAFDTITNDYKIIRLVSLQSYPLIKSRIQIYSANQDSWTDVATPIWFFTTQPNSSVIVKGVPYWSRNYKESNPIHHCQSKHVIASIHPHTGLHKIIPYPAAIVMDCHLQCNAIPFDLMDSLALLIHSRDTKSNQMFHVYALDDTRATWNKIYTTAPVVLQNQNIFIHRCFEDAGKTIIMGWDNDHRCSFLYDPKTDSLCHRVGVSRPIWDESYHHVETLFSVNGMGPIPKEDDNNQERGQPTYHGRELGPLFGAQFATFAGTEGLF